MFNFIALAIQKTGLLGVAVLMLLENLLPVIPSEVILPMAGFEAARGAFNPYAAALLGTLGSVIGGFAWYWFGWRIGAERLGRWAGRTGRWFALSSRDVDRGQAWFSRWGAAAVCIGRALPGVRGFICIPAGLAHMPVKSFLIWSSIGAMAWSSLLVFAGFELGRRYTAVDKWMSPGVDLLLAVAVGIYLYRVVNYSTAGRDNLL